MTAGHILLDRPAVCLDITRSVSRVGRGPATGIDRVELAYIAHFASADAAVFGLVRTALGYLLLDRSGLVSAAERLSGRLAWGQSDLLSALTRKGEAGRARAETELRRLAIDRAPRGGLKRLLQRNLPAGFTYLNVGHSHLRDASLASIRAAGADLIGCLIHDVIPLNWPSSQKPGSVQAFEDRMRAVSQHADIIITSADATKVSIQDALRKFGRVPKCNVIPLGLERPAEPTVNPKASDPYFVTVGTIDPRKGIDHLLDVWDELRRDLRDACPRLILIGRRGWGPEALHRRLDAAVSTGAVAEVTNCSDEDRVRLLSGAWAALQPSEMEGFGLPVFEAAALGRPVIATDLAVYRAFLGDLPVYVTPGDLYQWKKAIEQHIEQCREGPIPRMPRFDPPTWADHFAALNQLLMHTSPRSGLTAYDV